jgi:sialidase-1
MEKKSMTIYRYAKIAIGIVLLCSAALTSSCNQAGKDISVTIKQHEAPVLKRLTNNPVLQIKVCNTSVNVRTISGFTFDLDGTTELEDINAIRVYVAPNMKQLEKGDLFGPQKQPEPILHYPGTFLLQDTSVFLVSVEVAEKADLLHKIGIRCTEIHTDRGKITPGEAGQDKTLRLGVALRKHMDDDVDTYRIPGLTTTNNGTLLAVYDIRHNSYRDLQEHIDIGLSRSSDGGNSWEPMRAVLDMGEWGGLPQKYNGVSDANILVDRNTNTIFVAGLWMHGVLDKEGNWIEGLTEESDAWEHQWKNKGSQPGFGVKETSQFLLTKSTDDGLTWSKPINLTRMCKKQEWWLWAPAPGHGITLEDGTLVIPTQGRDATGYPFSNITWSKDGGETWQTSNPAYHNTTESMAVQLSDGSIMLNMRHNDNKNNTSENNGRAIAITNDLGETWDEHPTSRSALIEPRCMASLHKHNYMEGGEQKSILLFSNPNSKTTRHRMTIKVSFDDGLTWPEKYWMLLDEKKSKGYSCLTSIDEKTIGILFEGSRADMTFMKISLSELLLQDE